MAAGFVTLNILDGDGTTRTARFWSSDGTSAGLLYPAAVLTDGTGAVIPQGHGVAASALRVELPTDGTGVVGLNAGTAIIGKVATDQTTHGTTDLVAADITKVNGASVAVGHGVAATALRVELPTDGTGVVGLNAGSAIVGKVGIDQTTPGTTNAVSLTSGAFDVQTSFIRPANTTAYSAGDVLGAAAAATDLSVLGPNGSTIQINSVQLIGEITAIPAGQTSWVLYLYSVTPPSALADNAAFDLPSGDRGAFLGSIAIPTLVDLGSSCYVEVNNIGKQVKLAGTHLFAYLVTVGGFTPAANSETYRLTMHTVAL